MKKRAAAFVCAVLFGCGALSFAAHAYRSYDETAQDYPALSETVHQADGEYAVIVKTDGTRPDFRPLHPACTVAGPDDTYVVCFDTAAQADEAVRDTQAMRGVAYAEPNGVVIAQGASVTYTTYGAEMMGIDTFAQSVRSLDALKPVVVAVVDSGITPDLPIFQDRLLEGRSFVQVTDPDDPDSTLVMPYTDDQHEHGTPVAGIIADCTQGLPVQILPIRVLDDTGYGTYLDTANGIRYAVEQGADIVNLSFVSKTCSQYLHDAIRFAQDGNCLTVTSSGNYSIDMDKKDCCPAHMQEGIVVSGCGADDSLYKKSCYGSSVDLCAPAIDVPCFRPSGSTGHASGTSFAAPHVSAVAALFKLCIPTADCRELSALLTAHVRDIGERGFDERTGWGVPDLRGLDAATLSKVEHVAAEIRIISLPDKMEYYYKEPFDPQGFSAQVVYTDGTSVTTSEGFTFSGTDNMRPGSNVITAQRDGQAVKFAVDVRLRWWQWLIWWFLLGRCWY